MDRARLVAEYRVVPLVLGVDLGTTKITALAFDVGVGEVVSCRSVHNSAEVTQESDKARGYSEWDARKIVSLADDCLHAVATNLAERRHDLAGLGITGQQHGVVLLNGQLEPLSPLINWQDRRAGQAYPGSRENYVERAIALAGADAPRRTGCRLAAGYMGTTLFWMKEQELLPAGATACFLMDYFAATLTRRQPVTDATCAASSGLLDVAVGDWDAPLLDALGLKRDLFPIVRPSGDFLGGLESDLATRIGLPTGLPVFVGIGDNQASYLGSVGDLTESVLVNVGTGGQVATYTQNWAWDPLLETRPFPHGGFLLVAAGLCGGASYAVLERFFRQVGVDLYGTGADKCLFASMNRLAKTVPPGALGLRCEPYFTGTRAQPELRASWNGMSAENFTPACLVRALLEGMARSFRGGFEMMTRQTGQTPKRLVGAGNGLRESPILAKIVAETFEMPLLLPQHREEAAFGAALLAAVGAKIIPDLATAGRGIRFSTPFL